MKPVFLILGVLAALIAIAEPEPKASSGLVPLTDMGNQKYKGESGGLYGDGRNEPSEALAAAAKAEAAKIQPLDAAGKPSEKGSIALLGLGMSNTSQAFMGFAKLAGSDGDVSPAVVLVNGAQGGMDAAKWADKDAIGPQGGTVWDVVDRRLKAAGVTAAQVQAVWIKQAHARPQQHGEFPKHARKLQADLTISLQDARKRFPNLRLAFLSGRTYAGYAKSNLNPEPYAYETAFAVRWVIEAQQKGDATLNWDAAKGAVKAPLVQWGPYLWTDGQKGRKDGFTWEPEDARENDGTHETESGQQKAGGLLIKFLKSDPSSTGWFKKATTK